MAHVPAAHHNRILQAAHARVAELEQQLADILEPILARAGVEAAAAFTRRVHDHLSAAGGLTGDVTSRSTMVCLKPLPEEAEALAANGVDPSVLHVTLAYLGETEGPLQTVAEALAPVAATHAPLAGTVGGYAVFSGADVVVLLPDVPGLVELRVAATEALLAAGLDYARSHGFTAHMTVDDDPARAAEYASAGGQPLTFGSLWVVRGDVETVEVPLVGVPPLTASGPTVEGIAESLRWQQEHPGERLPMPRAMQARLGLLPLTAAATPPGDPSKWTAPAADEIIDVHKLAGNLRTKTDPVRRALIEQTMTPGLKAAGLDWDVTNPLTAKVLAQTGSQIVEIAKTTQLNVMRIVRHSYEQGLSIPDTAKAIRQGMAAAAGPRALLIARTEMVGAVNGGSLAAVQVVSAATGTEYEKEWLTAPGAPNPRHELYEGLDGQKAPLDGEFDVGGSPLQFPGDPNGPPEEVCNCRCTLVYDTPDGEQEADAEDTPDLP